MSATTTSASPVISRFGIVLGESPLLAVAHRDICLHALRYIDAGLEDAKWSAQLGALGRKLDSHFFVALAAVAGADGARLKRLAAGRSESDFAAAALASYSKSHAAACAQLMVEPSIPHFLPMQEEQFEKAVRVGGSRPETVFDPSSLPLHLTWNAARLKLARAEYRTASLHTLVSVVAPDRPAASKDYFGLQERLYEACAAALVQLFAVGTLQVGDAPAVQRWDAVPSLGPGG